jgi:S1-C subfamily serine protease
MKHKLLLPLIILVLVSVACAMPGGATQEAPTQAPVEQNTPEQPTATQVEPTATTPPVDDGSITNLDDAEKAVIRIVAEGAYEDPEFGQAEGAWSGSGFIIDPSGLAVTNNHVVTGAAMINVYFSGDDKARTARVLGVSECSDLALIDIEGDGYPYFKWYEGTPALGLKVYSLGYPLGDPEFTRHEGAVSKKSADISTDWADVSNVLEHDAIINPGNSGGPLVDENGRVVGINYASYSGYNQYYAITKAEALPLIEDLKTGKNVNSAGINGFAFVTSDATLSGIWVYSVESGAPADKAGVAPGDIITELEGIQLAKEGTMKEYCGVLRTHDPNVDTLNVSVLRWKTSEILEGQLNGRLLAVTDYYGGTTGGDNSGSTDTGGTTTTTSEPFYTEEFDAAPSNWSWFTTSGDESLLDVYADNGQMVFDLEGENIFAYLSYDDWYYQDVGVSALAENMGNNANMISLLCRYYSDQGWYEINIGSDGLWDIYRYDANISEYTRLYNGGSTNINMGTQQNEFTMTCIGDQISLYINGALTKTVRDSKYTEGFVGIGVSSFDIYPVIVGFQAVEIWQP